MRMRHGEAICDGTINTVRRLEQLINSNNGVMTLHDGSKGRHQMTGDYTPRSAFSRVYEIKVNGYYLRLRLWYDKRNGTARVSALPVHMTRLRQFLPGFGLCLWEVAKSGENKNNGGNANEKASSIHKSIVGGLGRIAEGKAGV